MSLPDPATPAAIASFIGKWEKSGGVAFWRTPLRNGNPSSAGSRPDPNNLAACFGKKTKARINQIEGILETLRSLGKLE